MIVEAPSTGKRHRANAVEHRTRCGLDCYGWGIVTDEPTCLHCLYPTRADLEARAPRYLTREKQTP